MGTQPAAPPESTHGNCALIVGELVTEPDFRTLPGGTEAMAFSLTVRSPDTATTSVPLIWYSPPKRVRRWRLGDQIVAVGSVVRRFYRAGASTGSRTEVMVADAERCALARSARIADAAVRTVQEITRSPG